MDRNNKRSEELFDLIDQLGELDVKLFLEGEQLRYSAPKGVLDETLLGRLKAGKEDLIRFLKLQKQASDQLEVDIPSNPDQADFPLTFAQQRFWFLDQLAGGNSPIYNMLPIVLQVDGPLQTAHLETALASLVDRHKVLSNKFSIEGDEPRQWPGQPGRVPVTIYDLSNEPIAGETTPGGIPAGANSADTDQAGANSADTGQVDKSLSGVELNGRKSGEKQSKDEMIARIILEEGERPFDLTAGGPLLRLGLIKLVPTRHIFILTLHHIVADGWSLGNLVSEFSQLYQAAEAGRPLTLTPLPIQYGDFALWERQRLDDPLLDRYLHFWKRELRGAPQLLELPTDRPRPRLQSYNGRTHAFLLDNAIAARIRQCANRNGVTPFMVLLTLFGMLLGRYSRQDDLVIGSPLSVRKHPQCEPLVGLFLNTIPLRIDQSGNPGFAELLERVKKRSLAAYEHGEVPFEELLQALDIGRALNHTPLFQVLFALQNAPVGKLDTGSLSITPLEPENSKAPFDLVLSMEEIPEGIRGRFRYNTDLFDSETIKRMAGHFRALLDSALEDEKRPVKQLTMIPEPELRELKQMRGGSNTYPVSEPLHEIIEKVSQSTPDADAVSFDGEAWSYAELNQRAGDIAGHLLGRGVTPGDRVGVCMSRSADLIASLLAILKTGAAYVPLDAAYPAERLDYMVQDAGIEVVVTDSETMDSVPASVKEQVNVSNLGVGDAAGAMNQRSGNTSASSEGQADGGDQSARTNADTMKISVDPSSVAYIIYTSGSTGRPKGVEVTHANVVRLFSSTESLFGFTEQDVWTLFHSYAFDFSVWEIFGALLYGGKLVVVPFWISRSPDAFFDLLEAEKVTVLNQTPSAFRQLVEIDRRDGGRETSLKWVVFGGEALEPKTLQGWCDRHGFDQPQLINMYGITETTVHVTFHRLTEADMTRGISVIGHPLPDLSVDLLDEFGNAVPLGVPGEIVVGGGGVANGYLNRPELTAERFVDAGKLYRSGDLARRLSDGTLDYLGRIDQQVKIRGFRIELGEIEACLMSHPQISSAVVIARETESGNELAGYVVFQSGVESGNQLSSVREHLAKQLPDYMIPASFVLLDEIPLTPNGKVDRKALPEPGQEQHVRETDYVAPVTRLEKLIAELWQDVLHIEKIGVKDNFFEMGGDSIKGAIFANRMQQKTGAVFYVVALFEAPTISELVDYMRIHYPDTVSAYGDGEDLSRTSHRLTSTDLVVLRQAIEPLAPYPQILKSPKNRRAIFVLAPPRSGTTLLRVLLGGHSKLFAPPELELMPFNTLAQRRDTYTGGDSFWLEGTLRAVMELNNCDAESAKAMMAERENAGMSVKEFYGEMQDWVGDRLLVDKSPSYVLDPLILQRIEETFEDPLYIHLHRHPCGMIRSFEEARLQQIFFRYPHAFTPQQLAELIWVHSHQTISGFLEAIPDDRKLQISFEEMTRAAESEVRRMCAFIGVDFEPGMLVIHEEQEKKRRMTDGIHKESMMLGDVKFHTHKRIDAATADRWRDSYEEDFLSDPARKMATGLGYEGAHVALATGHPAGDMSQTGLKRGGQNGSLNGEKAHDESSQVSQSTATSYRPSKVQDRGHSRKEPRVQNGESSREQAGNLPARPLSYSQQRLWFLDQLEGSANTYNMPVALWLNGPLDREALKMAVMAIPARHEVLRSRFISENGEPVCLIEESLPPPVVVDLQLLRSEEREKEAIKWLQQESSRSFDLAKGPLFRATLATLTPERHLLLITMHHIVSDGWSLGIVSKELEQFYQLYSAAGTADEFEIESRKDNKITSGKMSESSAGSDKEIEIKPDNGLHSGPAPLARQYSDYANWQKNLFTTGELDRQLAYWKDQLSDSPALLELPADRPRPVMKSYKGKTVEFSVGPDLTEKVKKLAEQSGSTLYMTLLAAFGVLMNRYSGQDVIPVGAPVANRRDLNFEPLIGFFVNTLVMKISIEPEESFQELLKRVRKVALEAYSNQDVSFEQIVDELQPERNMGYSPLFQVMMTMQAGAVTLPDLNGIKAEVADHSNTISKYDLTLLFSEQKGGLTGSLEYSSDLFDEWRIEQIGENFIELLSGITAEPSTSVKQLPMMAPSTRDRVLKEWNRTLATFNTPETLPDAIRETVSRQAEQTALVCGGSELSYAELESRSNRLAHYLLSLGVKKRSRIAVALDRSMDMVVSLLAVLKSGCCYVPLDPTYPANRIEMIFEDANIELLLSHSATHESMPECAQMVLIDEVMPTLDPGQFSGYPPGIDIDGDDLAYVIFTSGSTGRPKGVMIPHRAVLNMLNSLNIMPGISSGDTLLAVTTIAFDISVVELWGSLVAGARVVIATEEEVRDGGLLLELIRRQNISILQATPATWNLLIESGWEGTPGLKCLCGGEAMPRQLADELLKRCDEVWNMYGPTETTVWSSVQQIVAEYRTSDSSEPIGRPIANTYLYILDEQLNPIPPGIPGELYIGGKGVAAGYLNQPEMTAERFLPDPFQGSGRMYRTGDLARFRSDGVTEYLGRMDQQVKLRGYRIEPGEIEHQFKQFPGVQQCAVVIQGEAMDARLAAFYVPEEIDNPLQTRDLKDFLLSKLPDYMVPAVYFAVEEMPLTPNGKLDRKTLRGMGGDLVGPVSVSESSARDLTELRLLNLWQELLNDSSVGTGDNFFDSGGHSLVAVRLMAAIGVDFDRHLPLATLFQNPTVAQLARLLKKDRSNDLWSPLVEMRPGEPESTPLFCAPGAGGNVLYLQPLSKFIRKEIPFWGLQPAGLDGQTPPAKTVEELAACYLEGIETLNPEGPLYLSGHSFGGTVAFEMARQLRRQGRQVGKLILLDSPAPQWVTPTGLDWSQAEWLTQISRIASHQYGVELNLDIDSFEGLNDEDQLQRLQQRLIDTGVFPADSELNYLRGFLDVYRSNLQMEYKPSEQKLDVDLLLVRSADLQPDEITDDHAIEIRSKRDLGWEQWISGKIDVIEAPGDHLTMLNMPHVEQLADRLNSTLSETLTKQSSPI